MSLFRFQKFNVLHERSSMKVGTDGVLLGSWANLENSNKILDVGTGCGLIALMIAQRKKNAKILAIDIDEKSIEEAKFNFCHSNFSDRIFCLKKDFKEMAWVEKFDKIVCNPPFFDSKIELKNYTNREIARHQIRLKIDDILHYAFKNLEENGELDLVLPYQMLKKENVKANGFVVVREFLVFGNPGKNPKRVLLSLRKSNQLLEVEKGEIIVEEKRGKRHVSMHNLTSSFYL